MYLYDLDPKPVSLALFQLMNVRDVYLKAPQPCSQGVSSNQQRDPDLVWSRL